MYGPIADEFLEHSPDCEDIILLFEIENKEDSLKIMIDYEIYNELARRLFDLYNYDIYKVDSALKFISNIKTITKEIVHENLRLNNPVLFESSIKHAPYTALIMEFIETDNNFIAKFNKQKEIEKDTPPKR